MRMWYKKQWILTERALWSKDLKVHMSLDFAFPAESDVSWGMRKLIFRQWTTEKTHPLKRSIGITEFCWRGGIQELVIEFKPCPLSGTGRENLSVNTILTTAFIGQFRLPNKIVITDALGGVELNPWDTHCLLCQHCRLPQNSFIFNQLCLLSRPSQTWTSRFLYKFTHCNVFLRVRF